MLWATLSFNIPTNPNNAANAVFDGLADFINTVTKEDK